MRHLLFFGTKNEEDIFHIIVPLDYKDSFDYEISCILRGSASTDAFQSDRLAELIGRKMVSA